MALGKYVCLQPCSHHGKIDIRRAHDKILCTFRNVNRVKSRVEERQQGAVGREDPMRNFPETLTGCSLRTTGATLGEDRKERKADVRDFILASCAGGVDPDWERNEQAPSLGGHRNGSWALGPSLTVFLGASRSIRCKCKCKSWSGGGQIPVPGDKPTAPVRGKGTFILTANSYVVGHLGVLIQGPLSQ